MDTRGWTPVEDRLPNDLDDVLVTEQDYDGEITTRQARFVFGNPAHGPRWYDMTNVTEYGPEILPRVLAWMPLPAPYTPLPPQHDKCRCGDCSDVDLSLPDSG